MMSAHHPVVSVVIVNYRGTDDTLTCLRALEADLDYPVDRLQVICVDNASGDDSAERIRQAAPGVTVVEAERNLGFAGGCNLGVRYAHGTVLAFLNNDARPDRGWVREAVRVLDEHPGVGAVASKVLDWDGLNIDFVDAGLTWFGMGYKRHAGTPDDGSHDSGQDVLFGTGSALFVRTRLFRDLGGFDERFFLLYEDVDLGWRLNLRGWRVRYEPQSVAFHKHHASISAADDADQSRELFLLERNALAALYKNLSDETLAQALPAALALVVRRATARGGIDPLQLDMAVRDTAPRSTGTTAEIPHTALAGFLAIDQFVDLLPSLAKSRAAVQATRTRSDAELIPLMRKALEPAYPLPRYLAAHEVLVRVFGLEELFDTTRRTPMPSGVAHVLRRDAIRLMGVLRRDASLARQLIADGGGPELARRVRSRIRRVLGNPPASR